ncbi:MAG: hypothetical protein H3C28_05440 [Sphingomonadales bacterium]|nr:hypothetical protein [Sphingomonadales bacterium]
MSALPFVLGGMLAPVATYGETRASSMVLDEIIVTARKREESLQDTPTSITAASGQALNARLITSTQGIAEITPNLVVTQGLARLATAPLVLISSGA